MFSVHGSSCRSLQWRHPWSVDTQSPDRPDDCADGHYYCCHLEYYWGHCWAADPHGKRVRVYNNGNYYAQDRPHVHRGHDTNGSTPRTSSRKQQRSRATLSEIRLNITIPSNTIFETIHLINTRKLQPPPLHYRCFQDIHFSYLHMYFESMRCTIIMFSVFWNWTMPINLTGRGAMSYFMEHNTTEHFTGNTTYTHVLPG